jgi:tRNA pseudouridine55 synthase
MDGILNLLKPPGMTSHDVVNVVRRALGVKKVGHTGTLDPGVAGVLPICVGKATRLAEFVTGEDKAYRAEITFGIETDTQDSFGQITSRRDGSHLTKGDVAYALLKFQGTISQVPPMVSAIKVKGKRLYELAREGVEVERAPRPITIYRAQLLDFRPGAHPLAFVDVVCSKGTYIRTIAADLGAALGVGAHMSYLVRTRSGSFTLAEAATLEELMAGQAPLLAPVAALGSMLRVTIADHLVARLKFGVAPQVQVDIPPHVPFALLDRLGDLQALAEVSGDGLKLLKVFA